MYLNRKIKGYGKKKNARGEKKLSLLCNASMSSLGTAKTTALDMSSSHTSSGRDEFLDFVQSKLLLPDLDFDLSRHSSEGEREIFGVTAASQGTEMTGNSNNTKRNGNAARAFVKKKTKKTKKKQQLPQLQSRGGGEATVVPTPTAADGVANTDASAAKAKKKLRRRKNKKIQKLQLEYPVGVADQETTFTECCWDGAETTTSATATTRRVSSGVGVGGEKAALARIEMSQRSSHSCRYSYDDDDDVSRDNLSLDWEEEFDRQQQMCMRSRRGGRRQRPVSVPAREFDDDDEGSVGEFGQEQDSTGSYNSGFESDYSDASDGENGEHELVLAEDEDIAVVIVVAKRNEQQDEKEGNLLLSSSSHNRSETEEDIVRSSERRVDSNSLPCCSAQSKTITSAEATTNATTTMSLPPAAAAHLPSSSSIEETNREEPPLPIVLGENRSYEQARSALDRFRALRGKVGQTKKPARPL